MEGGVDDGLGGGGGGVPRFGGGDRQPSPGNNDEEGRRRYFPVYNPTNRDNYPENKVNMMYFHYY